MWTNFRWIKLTLLTILDRTCLAFWTINTFAPTAKVIKTCLLSIRLSKWKCTWVTNTTYIRTGASTTSWYYFATNLTFQQRLVRKCNWRLFIYERRVPPVKRVITTAIPYIRPRNSKRGFFLLKLATSSFNITIVCLVRFNWLGVVIRIHGFRSGW